MPAVSGDISVSQPDGTYIKKDPFTRLETCKSLFSRIVCSLETTLWHTLDAFNWAGYLAIWAVAGATFMVGMMALPIIIKSAVTGIVIMACEAIGEAVLRYYSTDEFPTDRLPVLLDRLPIEKLPVLGDFLSFKWLRYLPTQGERCDENKLTYFGSRMVVGGVYGSFLGFFSALINLSPQSILATGVVAAGVAFGLRVLMCAKVALDFVFLSRHEMNENRLYHKDNFVNRPIRERLTGSAESSRYIPMPAPTDIDASLQLLNLPVSKEAVVKDHVFNAAEARCNELAGQGLQKELFDRWVSLYRHTQEQLYQFIKQRDLQIAKGQVLQQRVIRQNVELEQRDRRLLGLPLEGLLTPEQIDAGYKSASAVHECHKDIDVNEIDRSAARLKAFYGGQAATAV
nr:hypothetical protein [Endozoicomonas sp.]